MQFSANSDELSFKLTLDECNFQEVIDEFGNSSRIEIVTYNISPERSGLYEVLTSLDPEKPIKIITNIPGRHDIYYNDNAKMNAKKNINKYLGIISDLKQKLNVTVLFNFKNHSKVILTDKVAYLGSANFSVESSKSYECGVIVRNSEVINELRALVENIERGASLDVNSQVVNELYNAYFSLCKSFTLIHEKLKEELYEFEDDLNTYHINAWDEINAVSILRELEDVLKSLTNLTDNAKRVLGDLTVLNKLNEDLINRCIKLVEIDSPIYKRVSFRFNSYQENYYNKNIYNIGDKSLDDFLPIIIEEARWELENLADYANDDISELEELLNNLTQSLSIFLSELILQINSIEPIDNTD